MRTLGTLFLVMTMLSALSHRAAGYVQSGTNAINGVVLNSGREPLNRMRVELLNEVEMFITQTYTDPAGRYAFRNLSQGTFIVKVHSDGKHVGQAVRVVLYALRNTGASHYEQLDFMLKDIGERKGSPIPGNTGATFVQEVPEKARKVYDRAIRQLENPSESAQGVESLKEALKAFPDYYHALERLGIEYVKYQQYEAARMLLTRAIEINRNGTAAFYGLGVAQYYLQQPQEAAESLRRSILLAPDSPNIAFEHFYLGMAYWKLNKHAEAEPHLKKAAELDSNKIPPDVHMHLAQYYSESHRYQEAANELETFLKLVPKAQDADKIKALIKQLRAKKS